MVHLPPPALENTLSNKIHEGGKTMFIEVAKIF